MFKVGDIVTCIFDVGCHDINKGERYNILDVSPGNATIKIDVKHHAGTIGDITHYYNVYRFKKDIKEMRKMKLKKILCQ